MIKEILLKATGSEPLPPRIVRDYDSKIIQMTPPFFDVKVADLVLRAEESSASGKCNDARELFSIAAERGRGVFERIKPKSERDRRLRAGYGIMLLNLHASAGEDSEAIMFANQLIDDPQIPFEGKFKISTFLMQTDRHLSA